MIKKEIILYSKTDNRPFDLDVVAHPDFRFQPIIIFLHGFKGFKDWGHFNAMAQFFAENGFAFCKFNFSHNGVVPGNNTEFADLDAFASNTLTKELSDLEVVFHYFESGKSASEGILVDKNTIILMGHSRGGGLAIIKAAQLGRRVKALITLSALASFESLWKDENLVNWKQAGRRFIRNSRTSQDMPLNYELLEDFLAHQNSYDILDRAEKVVQPWLIVHGEADETVPLSDALALLEANGKAETKLIPEATHMFGSAHPAQNGMPEKLKEAISACIDFLKINSN